VTLTPNGCRVLDKLGILNRLKEKSYIFEYSVTKDSDDKTVRKTGVTSDGPHFYPCYRLYRLALLQEMKTALAESQIPIFYDLKFKTIISDTPEGVVF
jgi:2-polyprenyl-6-methoxyphenol hydroxylase-like FAD-dependent oxidoreductase